MSQQAVALGLALLGLLLLYYGADWLVEGASALARAFGVSSFVIGMTVVAFGTSAPELLVSVVASIRGSSGLVLGNILGSNLSNIGLILGLSALVVPLATTDSMLRKEAPVLLGSILVFYAMAANRVVGRWEGILLLGATGVLAWLYWGKAKGERASGLFGIPVEVAEGEAVEPPSVGMSVFWVVAGIVSLVAGAEALVRGAVRLARMVGVSEEIIGFTLVALGTSLPELATSLTAAVRKQTDMCVGNVMGSNIMNVLLIGGVAATIRPLPATSRQLVYDFPAVAAISMLLVPFMWTGRKVSRIEGLGLLAFYVGYLALMFSGRAGSLAP